MINIFYLRDTTKVCGPGKTIINTYRTIDKSRFNLIVSAPATDDSAGNAFLSVVKSLGAQVEPLKMSSPWDMLGIAHLIFALRKHRCAILQTHDSQTRRMGILASLFCEVIHITSHHGWIENTLKQKIGVLLDKLLLRFATKVIVISDTMRSDYIEMGIPPAKLITLRNGILLSDYEFNTDRSSTVKKIRNNSSNKVVAIVGRLSPEKGHQHFLQMARIVKEKYPGVRFLIVGDGPLWQQTTSLAKDLGLEDDVLFLGHRTDMLDIYGAMDVLVVPSSREGLPNVVLEAFACGKPVVASRVGGIHEVVAHGRNGFLVDYGDVSSLAGYVLSLLNSIELARSFGQCGRQTIEQEFNFLHRTKLLEDLYSDLTKGNA